MALQLPRGRLKPQKTIPVVLDGVHVPPDSEKPVTLLVKYAGRANTGYFNAQASTPEAESDAKNAAATATASDLRLAKLYADHVIAGWENVGDGAGSAVPYTPELGLELLTFLIVDEQRPEKFRFVAFQALNPANFEIHSTDPVAVGKP